MKKRKATFMGIAVASLLVVASLSVFAKTDQMPNVTTDHASTKPGEKVESVQGEVYTIAEYEQVIADFEYNIEDTIRSGQMTKAEADKTIKSMKAHLKKMKESNGKYLIFKPEIIDYETPDADGKVWSASSQLCINSDDTDTAFRERIDDKEYSDKQKYLNDAAAAESK